MVKTRVEEPREEQKVPTTIEQPPPSARTLDDGYPNPKVVGFWEYLAALTPEQWDHHCVYVYRRKPRVEILEGAPGKYIGILTDPFTIEDLKGEFGGKVLALYLNRDSKEIMRFRVSIEASPKFKEYERPLEEEKVAELASGTSFAERMIDHLKEELSEAKQQGREADPMAAMRKSIELMSTGQQLAMESVLKSLPQQPNVAQMISAVAELQKLSNSQGRGGGVLEIIGALKDLGIIGTGAISAANPIAQLKDLLALLHELREESGGATESNPWAIVASKADTILDRAAGMMADYRRVTELRVLGRHGIEASGARPGTLAGPPPIVSPSPQPARSNVVEFPAPPSQPPAPTQDALIQYGLLVTKNLIVEMLHRGDDGLTAGVSVFRLNPQFALELAERLERKDAALAQDESLRHVFACTECKTRLSEFAEDFISAVQDLRNYGQLREEKEEPEPEPKS